MTFLHLGSLPASEIRDELLLAVSVFFYSFLLTEKMRKGSILPKVSKLLVNLAESSVRVSSFYIYFIEEYNNFI